MDFDERGTPGYIIEYEYCRCIGYEPEGVPDTDHLKEFEPLQA